MFCSQNVIVLDLLDSVSRATRGAGVCRQSANVNSGFSKNAAWIQVKFYRKLPINYPQMTFFPPFPFFKFLRIFFFSLTRYPMGAKFQNATAPTIRSKPTLTPIRWSWENKKL